MSKSSYLDQFPEPIKEAYWSFKGGCDDILESKEMLEVAETARTNGVQLEDGTDVPFAVHVFLKEGHTEIPDIVEQIADGYDLVKVKCEYRYNSDEISKVSFVREKDYL